MLRNKLEYLPFGAARYEGMPHQYVLFTEEHQLKSNATWDKFVEVFTEDSDDVDLGWRCEYWGKMMRGAALTYSYHPDPELYAVLERAVRRLLTTVRPDGRISTYSEEKQFQGWDMWGRKYVLTGALHFYRICPDESLKRELLSVLCGTADHIIAHVGEGKLDITATSSFWLGVNSCSILEPFVELYTVTGEKKYLEFAEYIIRRGGCSGGDLVAIALADGLAPYQYPERKAYETMSFFEGVLAYYQVSGEKKYLDAVQRFIERVSETDITVIGCSGCTHELFDNSAKRQTAWSSIHMQETCVTVTWMRVLARLHLLTGEKRYADRLEIAAYNALYGSVNTENQLGYSKELKAQIDPMPFDSYSPLYNNKRGLATGGFKRFRTGGYYGCCCCIAAAGVALFPLQAALRSSDGLVINSMLAGEVRVDHLGGTLCFTAATDYPRGGSYSLTLTEGGAEELTVRVRIPDWAASFTAKRNGEDIPVEDGYAVARGGWRVGDVLSLSLDMTLRSYSLNGRTAYAYGALILARDALKDGKPTDGEFTPVGNEYSLLEPKRGELLRLSLRLKDGELLLTDYQSCGKRWNDPSALVSVWLNAK